MDSISCITPDPEEIQSPRSILDRKETCPLFDHDDSPWTESEPVKFKKASLFTQNNILFWKNLKVLGNKRTLIWGHILVVFLTYLAMWSIDHLVVMSNQHQAENIPEAVPLPYLGKCTTKGCYSFAWGVLGENDAPWVNSTVDFLIDKGNLTETEDTRFVFKDSNPIKFLTEPGKEMNGAQVMVLFCTDYMSVTPAAGQDPVKIPCNSNQLFGENYGYWILYNSTLTKQAMLSGTSTPSGLNEVALATKRTIDEAIVNFQARPKPPTLALAPPHILLNYTYADFPLSPNRFFVNYETSSIFTPFWYFIPIIISFLSINQEVSLEKDRELRKGLMLFGISSLMYWTSWLLTCLVVSILLAIILTFGGWAFGMSMFQNTPFLIWIIVFTVSVFCFHTLALCIAAGAGNSQSSNKIAYAFMFACVFMQGVFGVIYLVEIFYADFDNFGINLVLALFWINPCTYFGTMLEIINDIGGMKYDFQVQGFVKGKGFGWDTFVTERHGHLFGLPIGAWYDMPSVAENCIILLVLTFGILIILWVIDNLAPTNRGFSRNPLYFVRDCRKGKKAHKIDDLARRKSLIEANMNRKRLSLPGDDADIQTQKIPNIGDWEEQDTGLLKMDMSVNASEGSQWETEGIYLFGITKIYQPFWQFCNKNPVKTKALDKVNLSIARGEIFALLGPNGAGKTTMISILSGVLEPTSGSYWSWGISREESASQIRALTNVCPQFDILWGELSVFDHIKLVARTKGIITTDIKAYAESLLRKVNLTESLHTRIENLSGGMRRRVSIALCTIGDPKILIFDEPTTGQDPENRRLIWKFINSLKTRERSILLTTHLLEEAEILSDRIGILSRGELVEVGTAAELKRNQGKGFKLTIQIASKFLDKTAVVEEKVLEYVSTARLYNKSGCNLMFQIPFAAEGSISTLLNFLESDTKYKAWINDQSISNTSLEEIFMESTTRSDVPTREQTDLLLATEQTLGGVTEDVLGRYEIETDGGDGVRDRADTQDAEAFKL